ncbi:MAG: class I SAM-dependent methyltransferase [Actinomycetota bacterium]|nr:class I SAM-dependent methyltransferase [Actinomycetota bacterium]
MAQPLIRHFVSDLLARTDLPGPVVEFGSLQVECDQDGDLRPLFAGCAYVGTDMREGPGVDRVEDLRSLSLADGEVGTALCLDTLEHCEDPPAACRELHRVVADGGLCVISSVMLFGIHGYPNDYFRFTPEGFRSLLGGFDDVHVTGVGDPDIPFQVVGVGVKGRRLDVDLAELPSLAAAQARWHDATDGVRIGPLRVPPRELARTAARELPRLARIRFAAARRARAGR